jgi:ABC-type antimicrobial peptide transport system permease subunit
MDPTVPLANIQTLADAVGASPSVSRASFSLLLLGIAAGMALLLSAIGVYGVVAQLVAERSGEIAVRIAVGARSQQVTAMVLGQSLRVALAGVIVGLAATLASTGMLRSVLFEVAPTDPLTLGGATALLLATVAAATYLAARRVGRIDPIRTLRAE